MPSENKIQSLLLWLCALGREGRVLLCLYLEVCGEMELHDFQVVAMFGEDWSDGIPDRAQGGHRHDLGDLVGEVDFKHIALVSLENVEML